MARRYLLAWMVAISTFVIGCDQTTGAGGENRQLHQLVCEITSESWGPVYPPGKVLLLRAYSKGDFEFDFCPEYVPDRAGIPFKSEIRKSVMSASELQSLQSAIEKLKASPLQTDYGPGTRILDSRVAVTVSFPTDSGVTKIVVNENDSHLHLESGRYPAALKRLLELADEIHFNRRKKLLETSNANATEVDR